ncbi:UNVERIFIED_CONTAM: hypothetical protein GTU68_032919 [Idotea baltica]|nr:hypothetical protein [Idotea baltica]
MIEIRMICENCKKSLPANSEEAMICGFECTFCRSCVEVILHNVCPNCGGGFEKRPIMPERYLEKYPPSEEEIYKPVDMDKFQEKLRKYRDIKPSER